jgi:hypothetical protein
MKYKHVPINILSKRPQLPQPCPEDPNGRACLCCRSSIIHTQRGSLQFKHRDVKKGRHLWVIWIWAERKQTPNPTYFLIKSVRLHTVCKNLHRRIPAASDIEISTGYYVSADHINRHVHSPMYNFSKCPLPRTLFRRHHWKRVPPLQEQTYTQDGLILRF